MSGFDNRTMRRTPGGSRGRSDRLVWVSVLALTIASCSLFAATRDDPHDWALQDVVGNTLTLVVEVGSSSCDHFKAVEVDETPTKVNITTLVTEREAGPGPLSAGCTSDLVLRHVDVVLVEPLGERGLVGCAPGGEAAQDYFGHIDGGRASTDCSEIVDAFS
jgi:hypothetical protein